MKIKIKIKITIGQQVPAMGFGYPLQNVRSKITPA